MSKYLNGHYEIQYWNSQDISGLEPKTIYLSSSQAKAMFELKDQLNIKRLKLVTQHAIEHCNCN